VKCEHKNCEHSKGVWVPTNLNRNAVVSSEGRIRKHSYCEICGTIEYKGEDRARKLGYFSNMLSTIKYFLERERVSYKVADIKITEAHVRLIMRELAEIEGFEDSYWRSFDSQQDEFIKVVRKYVPKLSASLLQAFFDRRPDRKQSPEELIMQLYGLYEEEEKEAKKDIYSDDGLYDED
jgi:hypothetical protein